MTDSRTFLLTAGSQATYKDHRFRPPIAIPAARRHFDFRACSLQPGASHGDDTDEVTCMKEVRFLVPVDRSRAADKDITAATLFMLTAFMLMTLGLCLAPRLQTHPATEEHIISFLPRCCMIRHTQAHKHTNTWLIRQKQPMPGTNV